MTAEEKYVRKRIAKAKMQSILFYLFRVFPIDDKKIVFMTIEGSTGFTCNPKYIALEYIEQNKHLQEKDKYKLVWLVNDTSKEFPQEIKVYKNNLWNRAFQLTTAKIWIDNSRKQLEVRKRKKQTYIQTWHAKLGFKPTGLDRGASFSRIAYLVSKHDSDMVDYWLSNSDWYDKTLKTGSLYEGKTIRCGSPRCDILVHAKEDCRFKQEVKHNICSIYNIPLADNESIDDIHFMMYAPTFREGSKNGKRTVDKSNQFPNFTRFKRALENRFGGKWFILLRLHPQLVERGIGYDEQEVYLLDGSLRDDMYELLAGCDAFMTDYSSAAFDAMVMEIPIFLYCSDYEKYVEERGRLLWDMDELPFLLAIDDSELQTTVVDYNQNEYQRKTREFLELNHVLENGDGVKKISSFLRTICR